MLAPQKDDSSLVLSPIHEEDYDTGRIESTEESPKERKPHPIRRSSKSPKPGRFYYPIRTQLSNRYLDQQKLKQEGLEKRRKMASFEEERRAEEEKNKNEKTSDIRSTTTEFRDSVPKEYEGRLTQEDKERRIEQKIEGLAKRLKVREDDLLVGKRRESQLLAEINNLESKFREEKQKAKERKEKEEHDWIKYEREERLLIHHIVKAGACFAIPHQQNDPNTSANDDLNTTSVRQPYYSLTAELPPTHPFSSFSINLCVRDVFEDEPKDIAEACYTSVLSLTPLPASLKHTTYSLFLTYSLPSAFPLPYLASQFSTSTGQLSAKTGQPAKPLPTASAPSPSQSKTTEAVLPLPPTHPELFSSLFSLQTKRAGGLKSTEVKVDWKGEGLEEDEEEDEDKEKPEQKGVGFCCSVCGEQRILAILQEGKKTFQSTPINQISTSTVPTLNHFFFPNPIAKFLTSTLTFVSAPQLFFSKIDSFLLANSVTSPSLLSTLIEDTLNPKPSTTSGDDSDSSSQNEEKETPSTPAKTDEDDEEEEMTEQHWPFSTLTIVTWRGEGREIDPEEEERKKKERQLKERQERERMYRAMLRAKKLQEDAGKPKFVMVKPKANPPGKRVKKKATSKSSYNYIEGPSEEELQAQREAEERRRVLEEERKKKEEEQRKKEEEDRKREEMFPPFTFIKMSDKQKPDDDSEYEYEEVLEYEEVSESDEEDMPIASPIKVGHSNQKQVLTSLAQFDVSDRNKEKIAEETQARGHMVSLVLSFPDKKTAQIEVPTGQTIEYVKSIIQNKFNVSFSDLTLVYEGTPMIDVFCISDYPSIAPKKQNLIEVQISH
ncbi:hypothetical protein BLNAU_1802 [Blattamonas nauphoetae]|uniref:Ubiquitin-like domain-containing protein n=1 Tax=Blattamonas nauphoetae TaxID=2049346 RepID=A0ABQ9YHQ1_9EUKA|nr:hypothetical protein BLNAU_1802 [Blattamonas nauphoetae]